MKIAVIGANGKTGRLFVDLAIQNGHQITAAMHNKNSLPTNHNLLTVKCDTTARDQVQELLKNQNAVVSFIGHTPGSTNNAQTKSINNVG